jgi:hypothetical protein
MGIANTSPPTGPSSLMRPAMKATLRPSGETRGRPISVVGAKSTFASPVTASIA